MTKYKLEYIWLDGYEPVPNLRSKTQVKEFAELPDPRRAPDLGLRRQLDAPGRGQQLGLPAPAGRGLPGPGAENGVLVMCEVLLPDGTPHPTQQPRDDP